MGKVRIWGAKSFSERKINFVPQIHTLLISQIALLSDNPLDASVFLIGLLKLFSSIAEQVYSFGESQL